MPQLLVHPAAILELLLKLSSFASESATVCQSSVLRLVRSLPSPPRSHNDFGRYLQGPFEGLEFMAVNHRACVGQPASTSVPFTLADYFTVDLVNPSRRARRAMPIPESTAERSAPTTKATHSATRDPSLEAKADEDFRRVSIFMSISYDCSLLHVQTFSNADGPSSCCE